MPTANIVCIEGAEKLLAIKKDVQELFERVFGKTLCDDAWSHFYMNAPYGCATVFVCYGKSNIVAHGGIIPQRLISKNGSVHEYYLQTAIMVDEDYRNLYIFKKLMDSIHRYVTKKDTFSLAFPNDNSYLSFIKMLRWRKITEYSIRQYSLAGRDDSFDEYKYVQKDYKYSLILDNGFLKWRGELNHLKVSEAEDYRIIYKDYEGALELLDVEGRDINFKEFMVSLGYDWINIPGCFLPFGTLKGLKYVHDVGISQRMCFYPGEYPKLYYDSIKPSSLLSDVF
jgi:hypothetical protein